VDRVTASCATGGHDTQVSHSSRVLFRTPSSY